MQSARGSDRAECWAGAVDVQFISWCILVGPFILVYLWKKVLTYFTQDHDLPAVVRVDDVSFIVLMPMWCRRLFARYRRLRLTSTRAQSGRNAL